MAAPFAPVPGANGRLYMNLNAAGLVPVWAVWANVRDVETPLDWTKVDISGRYSGRIKIYGHALGELPLSITSLYNRYDAIQNRLRNAAGLNVIAQGNQGYGSLVPGLPIELLIFDQDKDTVDSEGFRCAFGVFKYSRKEGLDGMMEAMFEMSPCLYLNPFTSEHIPATYVRAPFGLAAA